MIVGTAGHIDHGKTTLVHALTGVDTDRLPEEKRRGISIELGYAFLDVPQGADDDGPVERIGFIDVPGHERLVRTMIAGATAIDHALLLVAADDGVMPQTREHLAVLSLLGLTRGTVVITKTDRADAARLAEVRGQVEALLADSTLRGAPVMTVSAHSGAGIAALREHLVTLARQAHRPAEAGEAFRLAIDRAFTLDGVGTVVTGTIHAGTVSVGDELALVPAADRALLRVRSLHAQNRPVQQARAGQRCAVALAGVARDDIERGQWLVTPPAASAGDRIDVLLTLWTGETRALRSGTAVQVHLGAASVPGTVAVLDGDVAGETAVEVAGNAGGRAAGAAAGDGAVDQAPGAAADAVRAAGSGRTVSADGSRDTLAPGGRGLVQLVLRKPIGAWRGDRVVLRDPSQTRTIGGGTVIDPHAPARYRRTPQRFAELAALRAADAAARFGALLAAAPNGVDVTRLAAAEGLREPGALTAPPGTLRATTAGGDWALGEAAAAAAEATVLRALSAFHERHPDEMGPDSARLRRLALPRLPEPLWRALIRRLQDRRQLVGERAFLHLPEHGVQLSAVDQRIAQKVGPRLAAAGFDGAWARDLARDSGEPEALMRTTLARLAQRGELHQVVKDLYYDRPTMTELARIAREVAASAGGHDVRAAAFRDGTRLGRKRAIQILEYFDRVGMLRRVGDVHKLRTDTSLFLES